MTGLYQGGKKTRCNGILEPASRSLAGMASTRPSNQIRDGLKAAFNEGMLFEEMGFRYFGPVDGHDLPKLAASILQRLEGRKGARSCCTSHGQGARRPAGGRGPGHVPHPAGVRKGRAGRRHHLHPRRAVPRRRTRTRSVSEAIHQVLGEDKTARRSTYRRDVPGEQAGEGPRRLPGPVLRRRHLRVARRGVRGGPWRRPGRSRSSTSTARSCNAASTRSSRKCALQNLPVVFTLDRAGLDRAGRPDAPRLLRHPVPADVPEHDLSFAPGDEGDVEPMLKHSP